MPSARKGCDATMCSHDIRGMHPIIRATHEGISGDRSAQAVASLVEQVAGSLDQRCAVDCLHNGVSDLPWSEGFGMICLQ